MNPNVSASTIVIAFEPNRLIRRRVFEFEDRLESVFKKPFQVFQVPDNYNPGFPRFQADSHNGHSRLEVSQQELKIETSYGVEFATDIASIGQYVTERVSLVKDLVRLEKVMYVGLVLTLDFALNPKEINAFAASNSGLRAIDGNTREFSLRYSTPYKEDFFLVVSCTKYIQQSVTLDSVGNVAGNEGMSMEHGIEVTLDLNSKKGFQEGNTFDDHHYDSICEILFGLVSTCSLEDYLSGKIQLLKS
jgi:hypothetical protein